MRKCEDRKREIKRVRKQFNIDKNCINIDLMIRVG